VLASTAFGGSSNQSMPNAATPSSRRANRAPGTAGLELAAADDVLAQR